MATAPQTIVIGHPQIYLADAATAFPTIAATPAAAWVLLGDGGNRSQSEDGVTITHAQELVTFRPGGTTAPRKVSRVSEDLMITVTLMDMSLEAYRYALNRVAVDTSTADEKSVPIVQGDDVRSYAMLIRGDSPDTLNNNAQYEIPLVVQSGSPSVTFSKGEYAGLALEFMALESGTGAARFGSIRYGDA